MDHTPISTYSKDTPVGRPDIDGRAGVFVPSAQFDRQNSATIKQSAGIVGLGNPDGSLTVYYEANRFDESSLHSREHKTRKAYDRMVADAPTVSKVRIGAQFLDQVGLIDGRGINLKNLDGLRFWFEQSGLLDTAPHGDVVHK